MPHGPKRKEPEILPRDSRITPLTQRYTNGLQPRTGSPTPNTAVHFAVGSQLAWWTEPRRCAVRLFVTQTMRQPTACRIGQVTHATNYFPSDDTKHISFTLSQANKGHAQRVFRHTPGLTHSYNTHPRDETTIGTHAHPLIVRPYAHPLIWFCSRRRRARTPVGLHSAW